ncbi:hypothetical protein TELCIR_22637, partial [Teladorsagia circumcincta]
MHFAKDPVVINAASAAVRQLVGCVFERVIQEDGVFSTELTVVPSSGGRPSPRSAPPTLRPCAADAYLLFKDLCLLINAKPSVWLVGIHEMTRTLGLELIENILKSYPGVFFRHPEFCDLLKSEVCPLVIKLFSPSLKSAHVSSQHPSSRSSTGVGSPTDRPYFPIAMRLVRIILCLISLYHQLLPTECEIFLSSLIKFVDVDRRGWQRALSLEALHRVVVRPDIVRLDSLERHEAGVLPEGYVVSRANCALIDFVQAVYAAVDALSLQENGDKNNNEHVADSIFTSCQPNLLAALSLLLSASTDETVTDQLLCALSTLMSVGCKLKVIPASLNCLYVLCCACLPSATYLRSYAGAETPTTEDQLEDLVFDSSSALHEVVVSGTPCPSSVVVPDKWNDQVMAFESVDVPTYCLAAWNSAIFHGYFCTGKGGNSANVITTAALSKIPILASLLDKVACSSVSLSDASLLKAIEAMMRISDENVAVAATGRECSLFPLAMLLRFASLNLQRQQVFWDRVTAHFIKVCGHISPSLREWAAVALSSIIKQAFKAKTGLSEAEHQSITLKTLRSMCSIHQADVQRRQLDCLMALLQTDGAQLVPEMWQHVIFIVAAVVDEENWSVYAFGSYLMVWLVLYTCLSELCVDVRPSVRKSACQTLLQTVASHGHALRISTWNHMIWQ